MQGKNFRGGKLFQPEGIRLPIDMLTLLSVFNIIICSAVWGTGAVRIRCKNKQD